MELFLPKSDEKNDHTKINNNNIKQIQYKDEANLFNATSSDESLLLKIRTKVLIFILLFFTFIISFINSVTENTLVISIKHS
jgi:hypothetical protein